MGTPAPAVEPPALDGPRLPGELIVGVGELLLQSRQYATLEALALALASKGTRNLLGLTRKRFRVVRGNDVDSQAALALEPGGQYVE
ncbi:hypothetical protein NCC49_000783 [Naganishia albida]|nr:hypothetical protein NCC49_000783 [Naganishia albida]